MKGLLVMDGVEVGVDDVLIALEYDGSLRQSLEFL